MGAFRSDMSHCLSSYQMPQPLERLQLMQAGPGSCRAAGAVRRLAACRAILQCLGDVVSADRLSLFQITSVRATFSS
jgi:hypothetical protein